MFGNAHNLQCGWSQLQNPSFQYLRCLTIQLNRFRYIGSGPDVVTKSSILCGAASEATEFARFHGADAGGCHPAKFHTTVGPSFHPSIPSKIKEIEEMKNLKQAVQLYARTLLRWSFESNNPELLYASFQASYLYVTGHSCGEARIFDTNMH
ncbi:hypothetical protein Mapa_013506 [Marchantia paleacea]|nr:hypothetical protein Mapa_013506 [Marchantia paleacea]